MEKELKIQVHINSNFEFDEHPDLSDWNNASHDEKQLYIENRVKYYIHNNINQIIDDSEITDIS